MNKIEQNTFLSDLYKYSMDFTFKEVLKYIQYISPGFDLFKTMKFENTSYFRNSDK